MSPTLLDQCVRPPRMAGRNGYRRPSKSSKSHTELERLKGKILARVHPYRNRQPAHAPRERRERLDAVLVAVLGMNRFAGAEINCVSCDLHFLPLEAGEMHFDPM